MRFPSMVMGAARKFERYQLSLNLFSSVFFLTSLMSELPAKEAKSRKSEIEGKDSPFLKTKSLFNPDEASNLPLRVRSVAVDDIKDDVVSIKVKQEWLESKLFLGIFDAVNPRSSDFVGIKLPSFKEKRLCL